MHNRDKSSFQSPKLLFKKIDAGRDLIKDAYNVLNLLQNRSPYNSSIELVLERAHEDYQAILKVVSQGFEVDVQAHGESTEELLLNIKKIGLAKIKQWNSARFDA